MQGMPIMHNNSLFQSIQFIMILSDGIAGKLYTISKIDASDDFLKARLKILGLSDGALIKIERISGKRSCFMVSTKSRLIALSGEIADKITVDINE